MSRFLGVLAFLIVIAAAVVYLGSPVYAFQQLRDAARAGDKDRLEALVDFPAVRENLKTQVDSKAVKLARQASGVGVVPVMVLGKLGAALGDRAVDKLVTPEAIAAMAEHGQVLRHGKKDKPTGGEGKVSYAYLTLDRFRVRIAPNDHPDLAVGLILQRQGLASWRVEAIELPEG